MIITEADVAGAIARLLLDKDPRRYDADTVPLVVGEWARALDGYPTAALHEVVDEMLRDPDQRFPTIGEVLDGVKHASLRARRRQEAIARAQIAPRPGMTACMECGDDRIVWVKLERAEQRDPESGDVILEAGTVDAVAPCPLCRPEDHAYQMGGHLHHTETELDACPHPRCRKRSEARPIRRRHAPR